MAITKPRSLLKTDRRSFMAWLLALGVAPSGIMAATAQIGRQAGASVAETDSGFSMYLAARKRQGQYEAVLISSHGVDRRVVPLPDRGHSFAIDARRNRAVAFGRQPGFFAVAFDFQGLRPPLPLPLAEHRHFFGHGVFTPDGNLLFATENDFKAGRGVLGIYDASPEGGYRRLGEYATGGVGPHEVILLSDGKTLCVANGGILTHPDYGKLELNLDSMQPSLAYLDARDGRLLEQVFLPAELHSLSLRHMALDASGAVWVGCQYMGPATHRPALVARHRRGEPIQLFAGPPEVLRSMRNYVGSVAVDATGRVVATSSPVGNCIVFWNAATGGCIGRAKLEDGCGVAPLASKGFLLSSGLGVLATANPAPEVQPVNSASGGLSPVDGLPVVQASRSDVSWDNHMRIVPAG